MAVYKGSVRVARGCWSYLNNKEEEILLGGGGGAHL